MFATFGNAMKKLSLLLLLASGAAMADEAALQHCRTLADGAARLACYDAIPPGFKAHAGAAPAAASTAAPAHAAVPASAAPAVDRAFEVQSSTVAAARAASAPTLETSIVGEFEGWGPGQTIRLANGQIWRVEDDSSEIVYITNPKVSLRKGMMGAVFMDIQGARGAPKVRRIQ